MKIVSIQEAYQFQKNASSVVGGTHSIDLRVGDSYMYMYMYRTGKFTSLRFERREIVPVELGAKNMPTS